MDDHTLTRPDYEALFAIASSQMGYFMAPQARECGFGWDSLSRNTRSGRFLRVRRGLYRFRDYPSSRHEQVMAGWLAAGSLDAVVSHESALDILDLSDVVPNAVHLTVPRSRRYTSGEAGVRIYTSATPPSDVETITRLGMRVTTPLRTILDSAESGVAPEQVEAAVHQAIQRGLVSSRALREASRRRSGRVQRLIHYATTENEA